MLAYKFRSPAQIEFAFDILFNQRLHCAPWSALNDPLEAMFSYSCPAADAPNYADYLDNLKIEKKQLRICSLSSTFNCHLLWAHYAAGFRGLALEMEFPKKAREVVKVNYRDGVFHHLDLQGQYVPADEARRILSSKYREWAYEREIRILHNDEWYNLPTPVRRVIVGHRMHPSLIKALQVVCERNNVLLNRTGLGDEGIDADPLEILTPVHRGRA